MHLFYWGFCWSMLALGKVYFEYLVGIPYFSECITCQPLNESQFDNASFLLGRLLKSDGLRRAIFWHLSRVSDFSECMYTISVNISFTMHLFFYGDFCWNVLAWGKQLLYFEHSCWTLDFSECIHERSVHLASRMHLFYWGFCWNMLA